MVTRHGNARLRHRGGMHAVRRHAIFHLSTLNKPPVKSTITPTLVKTAVNSQRRQVAVKCPCPIGALECADYSRAGPSSMDDISH